MWGQLRGGLNPSPTPLLLFLAPHVQLARWGSLAWLRWPPWAQRLMTANTPPRQTQAEEEDALAVAEADDDSIAELCDTRSSMRLVAALAETVALPEALALADGKVQRRTWQARARSSTGQGCAPKSFWRRSKAELVALKAAAEKAEAANKERER